MHFFCCCYGPNYPLVEDLPLFHHKIIFGSRMKKRMPIFEMYFFFRKISCMIVLIFLVIIAPLNTESKQRPGWYR